MPRFHMLEHLLSHDREFQDFFASLTGGTSGHDHLNGTESGNMLFAGRGDDDVTGMAGNDRLDGGNGNDMMWGGFGADHLNGGAGNDVLLSRSDAGEMVAAQDGTTQIFAGETAAFTAHDDVMTGGRGADTFRFEGLVNAKDEIVAKHVNADGTI